MLSHWKTRLPFCPVWPETANLEGIAVPIRHSPFPPRLRRHLMNGGYETAERRLIQEFVKTGDQVLEIGASAGVVTSFLWRQVGSGGRVVSVEGNPTLRPWFEAQQAANGFRSEWVEALCRPTWEPAPPPGSDETGLLLRSNPLGSSSEQGAIGDGGVWVRPGWKTARQICEAAALTPTVLIADIEGTEAVWIDTPPRLPDSVRLAIVEFHPAIVGAARAGECVQALVTEGFAVCGMAETVLALRRG